MFGKSYRFLERMERPDPSGPPFGLRKTPLTHEKNRNEEPYLVRCCQDKECGCHAGRLGVEMSQKPNPEALVPLPGRKGPIPRVCDNRSPLAAPRELL